MSAAEWFALVSIFAAIIAVGAASRSIYLSRKLTKQRGDD